MIVTLSLIILALVFLCGHFYKKSKTVVSLNEEVVRLNDENAFQLKEKQNKISLLSSQIQEYEKAINTLKTALIELDLRFKNESDTALSKIQKDIEVKRIQLQDQLKDITIKVEQKTKELEDLKQKQQAFFETSKREKQMQEQLNYYRLAVEEKDLHDVQLLRQIQTQCSKKEAIDRVIWEIYYRPAYDVLMTHLFSKEQKVSGIYRITSLTTQQSYIGQSVDIKERFRAHIKNALSYSYTGSKLYSTMKKDGLENFTFEILELVPKEKLNERESYWIDFYQTKDFGLNSTKGGS